jgi:hypothetical protein
MPHNIDLPTHRYVWVRNWFIYNYAESKEYVPAVWFGMSSHPGRSLGCHVMLDNGATVIDLPLIALASRDLSSKDHVPAAPELSRNVAWDCFGWQAEAYEPDYLSGMTACVLDERHNNIIEEGTAWFAVDWIENGWSHYPEQHKWLWIVSGDSGNFWAMPQDRLLFKEASFTDNFGKIPDGGIKRQRIVWKTEE